MQHLGDITKISGYAVPAVDAVVGGSPCQDLSIAGKRAGLSGGRSGLFMEQIRIIKEMRARDRNDGRTGVAVRPRYMVWENVPGVFSSNAGEDFRTVLEETARVADETAAVPRPPKGKWTTAGCIMGDGWSIAWRVLDAQFWGVPQRRRRIALVADLGGASAPEILFVRESVCGHPETGAAAQQGAAGDPAQSAGADRSGDAFSFQERGGKPGGGKGILIQHDRTGALSTLQNQYVTDAYGFGYKAGAKAGSIGYEEEKSVTIAAQRHDAAVMYRQLAVGRYMEDDSASTMKSRDSKDATDLVVEPVCYPGVGITSPQNASDPMPGDPCHTLNTDSRNYVVYDTQGNGNGETAGTLTGDHQRTVSDHSMVVAYGISADASNAMRSENPHSGIYTADTSRTLDTGGASPACNQGGIAIVDPPVGVRRLTPLECERLQGYPDGWTDIGEWTDTKGRRHREADSPRYMALGNSIALPPWKWVMKRLCAQYERDATLASLFDGIGGFPYIWEQINGKGSCLWASEIEEFPIAVTKARIG